jgi:hypothetical protein
MRHFFGNMANIMILTDLGVIPYHRTPTGSYKDTRRGEQEIAMSSAVKDRVEVPNAWLTQLFPLRVWAEYDSKYETYVAYCVETGSVTTAEDMETTLDMMRELLEDELSRVMVSRNVGNLFSTPAPIEIRHKWTRRANEGGQIGEMKLNIKVPTSGGADARDTSTTKVAVLRAAA